MKLVNVTNSHSRLVLNQLENTDAHMVKVYTAGNTMVIYTEAPEHNEILLINENRNIQSKEIEDVQEYFLNKIHDAEYHKSDIQVIELPGLVEISIPKRKLDTPLAM
ncbi:hypothetical protein A5844_002258 [Enterococcus sp. 10A9_DIV0425]|uniref:Uncharacterized protein n=1 Tax=Candidatus Enterococcus wittei TaxID=1987383 RepID=A0A242JW92_9ENTE|nr:DUF1827 family protein [Enterococcus sp. 10A9_DIV0425]OTP09480.1 hypothetical protein A5844_002258 [Enterococcus sp. 10A9_DIV0425]THE09328.1 DUF1827 family protein [Enterococcus hirae]